MKKKIAHISSVHSRTDTRIYWKQCLSLGKSNYDVYLIVSDNKPDETLNNVKIINVSIRFENRFTRILFLPVKLLKAALLTDCDLYVIHDPELIPIGLRLKKAGKKVIFDSHEDFPRQILEKDWIPSFMRRFLSWLADRYYRSSLRKFDKIFTVTPHIVESLSKSSDKISMITNYPVIEGNNIDFSFSDYAARINKMCYTGTVYSFSQQENTIKALESLEEVNYIIVGTILEDLRIKLAKLPAWEKVTLTPRVSRNSLKAIYEEATIGIVIFNYAPNLGNKIGTLGNNKIFEYMQHALPIICTDFELWKAIVNKYRCGITVNPNNISEIADAVKYLIENKEEAYLMGQNGRRAVSEEYNWASQEKILLNEVDKILSL